MAPHRPVRAAWLLYLLVGAVATAAYAILPSESTFQAIVSPAVSVAAAALLFRAAARSRTTASRVALAGLALGWTLTAGGDTVWRIEILLGLPDGPGSVADFLFLGLYPPVIAALLLVIRSRERSAVGVLDAGVLASALLVVAITLFIEPYLASAQTGRAIAAESLYVIFDVMVLAAVIRLAAWRRLPSTAMRLALLGLAAHVVSDLLWNWPSRLSAYDPGSWADCGWLLAAVLLGAAALHPSATRLADPSAEGDLPRRRLWLLPFGLFLALFPILHLVPSTVDDPARAAAVAAIGSVCLGLARLWLLLRENARALGAEQRLTEQLRQAQKLEAVGALAAGIAHDFNNQLTVILGQAELVRARLAAAGVEVDGLAEIEQAAGRTRDLTRQLLAFGRRQTLFPQAIEVAGALEDMRPHLDALVPQGVELAVAAAPDAGRVWVDPAQLREMLSNLVVNAQEAMPAGGRLEVAACRVEVDVDHPALAADLGSGSFVAIAVSDTGHGMDEATRARIFEPFFTTKRFGSSSGLGLAMTYGIVRQSGGTITVESAPSAGTTVTVYLPSSEAAPALRP